MQEFNLSYMTNKTHVNIENRTLHAKIGPLIKKNIELSSIQYFFINEYKEYRELIIRYTKPNGKVTNVRLLCAYGVEDLDNLANTLGANLPSKDIRKMEPKEAMKLMKAVNTQKMALWIVVIILPLVMTIFFLPGLTHYFDSGHEDVRVEDIIAGQELSSHNLTLEGVVLNKGMWEKTTTTNKGSTTTTIKNFFPLVSQVYNEGEPIFVLIETGDMSQLETDEFVLKSSFTGTLRNVMWEGIASDQIEFFKNTYGLTFDKNAVLFELCEGRPDGYVIWAFGTVLAVVFIILIVVWFKSRKNM